MRGGLVVRQCGRIANSGQAVKKKRGAWQNHTRLSHKAINSYRTSLDHLLLDKAVDIPIIKPSTRINYVNF
jgi:hypothetical protein